MIDAFLGFICGFVSGFLPGFYITQLLVFSPSFEFIICSTVAFLFTTLFPSILLSCPTSENHLIVLPAFEMLKQGRAIKAIDISLFSSLISVFFSFVFLLFFYFLLKDFYQFVEFLIPFLLILALILLLKSFKHLAVIAVSSLLGILLMNQNLLIPMLTGFFGLSSVLISLHQKIPTQLISNFEFNKFEIVRTNLFSGFISSLFAFVPTVSSNISAMFSKLFFSFDKERFISFAVSTNVYYMIFSFFAVFLISKARTGPAFFLMNTITLENAFYTLGLVFVTAVIAFYLANLLKKNIIFFFQQHRKLILIASIFLILLLNTLFFNFYGLLVLLTATLIGLLCYKLNVTKITCMSSMIVPTLVILL